MSMKPGMVLKPLVKIGRNADDCWQWLGPITENGYGAKTFCGEDVLAHRWMWMQLFGPIPAGLVVYRTCGTRDCTNPHHLRCGTQAENVRNGATATLTPFDVIEIKRAEPKNSLAAKAFAVQFGVSDSLIFDIWGKRAWARARAFNGPKRPSNQHIKASQTNAAPAA